MSVYDSISIRCVEKERLVASPKPQKSNLFKKIFCLPFPPGFSQFPSVKIVLLVVLLHRIHIYSTFNFINGLSETRENQSTVTENSAITAQLFMSSALFLAPLPGLIADKYVPRAKMVMISLILSFIGSFIQSIFHSIYELADLKIDPFVYYFVHITAILFLTVGSSGAYALLVPVGVDQMEGANEVRLKSYFNWHYWFINVGALLAAGRYFIYVGTQSDRVILLASSYLATLSIFLALILLMISLHCSLLQRNQPPGGTPLKQVVGVVWCALSNRYSQRRESTYSTLRLSDYALLENRGRYSYEQVQDVKTFFKILFVLISMVWYFGVYNLLFSVYVDQGQQISCATDTYYSNLVIFLTDCTTILLLLPIFEFFRWKCQTVNFSFSKILYKFQVGIVFAFFSILFALTLNLFSQFGVLACGSYNWDDGTKASLILQRIPAIIPQSLFISVSECFAIVGSMEFVYAQSPHQMKGFIFGILQCFTGIGFYIPIVIYIVLRATSCDSLNSTSTLSTSNYTTNCLVLRGKQTSHGTNDYVFYTIYLGCTLVYCFLFFAIAKFYQRRERQKIETWPNQPRVSLSN